MEEIDGSVWTYRRSPSSPQKVPARDIRRDETCCHRTDTFQDLVTKIAELSFRNRKWFLLFRGQARDYRTQNGTVSLYPAIYRDTEGKWIRSKRTLRGRFEVLSEEVDSLIKRFKASYPGQRRELRRLERHFELCWSLLQHYGFACTPYLDFTASIRVAATFATAASSDGYVYVIAVPYPAGTISHLVDYDLKLVRLQAACAPLARRPHFQEGYMVGSCYVTPRAMHNQNVSRRLIARFHIPDKGLFWDRGKFDPVPMDALYPCEDISLPWIGGRR